MKYSEATVKVKILIWGQTVVDQISQDCVIMVWSDVKLGVS